MVKTVSIKESIVINKPIDTVWKISAHEFVNIDHWDANVKVSQSKGAAKSEAMVSGRVCHQYNGRKTVEDFVEYNESHHTFTYIISEGLPGFVVSARNTWVHEAESEGKTKLTMHVIIQINGLLGTLMQVPMKSQMGKILRNAQEELKYYIENGQPHPRKQRKIKNR